MNKKVFGLLMVYLFLLVVKIDFIDRLSIFYLVKYRDQINIDTNMDKYLNLSIILSAVAKGLLIPFNDKYYLARYTEGYIYSSHIPLFYDKKTIYKLNNKLYWYDLFEKYNINYPKIIAYNGKIVSRYDDNKYYISKPYNGTFGIGVKKIMGNTIQHEIQMNNVIIQDLLIDCLLTNKIRHFRYVSLYDKTPFLLWEMTNTSEFIASNKHNGGKASLCNNVYCKSLSKKENVGLKQLLDKLNGLHNKEYNNIFCIGWDIMINCIDNTILFYCLEGNIYAGLWFNGVQNHSIQHFKNKFYHFLRLKNILNRV